MEHAAGLACFSCFSRFRVCVLLNPENPHGFCHALQTRAGHGHVRGLAGWPGRRRRQATAAAEAAGSGAVAAAAGAAAVVCWRQQQQLVSPAACRLLDGLQRLGEPE